jgi:hypothetical protein
VKPLVIILIISRKGLLSGDQTPAHAGMCTTKFRLKPTRTGGDFLSSQMPKRTNLRSVRSVLNLRGKSGSFVQLFRITKRLAPWRQESCLT